MSKTVDQAVLSLFEQVVDLSPDARAVFLEQHCADPTLRQRVEAMLAVDAADDGLLDIPADEHLLTLSPEEKIEEKIPETIGQYRILGRLGQGGMAVVYRAERADGEFDQTVALKLILPSRLTAQWRDRFLQERQILASLHHPNIAQLLDGGVYDDGSPYFALEFVDGVPINDHCDLHRLTINQRLELMLAVCNAVSYAHRNLIVHRDLKPSNILVDDNGVIKLLDFGIAKLLSEEDSGLTATGQRALTPDYAAPEQFLGEMVTTATDVYALGVLLYELLTGRRPYVSTTGSPLDIERQMLDRGPPSFTRLAAEIDPDEARRIAAARRLSWPRLQRTVSGDLENVVLKAMRREPERRYASAEALAEDIRRYAAGLPVQARADSGWYQFTKFVGRHRTGVILGSLAALGLVLSTTVALQQASQARLEARKATETKDFLTSLFEYASPDKSLGDRLTARQLLDLGASRVNQELADEPELRAELLQLLADTYVQIGIYDPAQSLAEMALLLRQAESDEQAQLSAILSLARLLRLKGDYENAQRQLESAGRLIEAGADPALQSAVLIEQGELAREQARFEDAQSALDLALEIDLRRDAPPADLARDLYRLATLKVNTADNEQALVLMESAADQLAASGNKGNTQYAMIRHDLGVLLIQKGDLDQAKQVLTEVKSVREGLLGNQHPDLAVTLKELAGIARLQGQQDEAEKLYLDALAINEAMLGSDHPETSNNLNSLAVFYRGLGQNDVAVGYAERALSGAIKTYGQKHPTVGVMTLNIGNLQRMLGNLGEAEVNVRQGLQIILDSVGEQHHLAGVGLNALADIDHAQGRLADAEKNYLQALEVFGAAAGPQHPHMLNIHAGTGRLMIDRNQLEQARYHYQQAVTIGEAALPDGHPNTSVARLGLAHVMGLSGECSAASEILNRHLPRIQDTGLGDRPDVVKAVGVISSCAPASGPE